MMPHVRSISLSKHSIFFAFCLHRMPQVLGPQPVFSPLPLKARKTQVIRAGREKAMQPMCGSMSRKFPTRIPPIVAVACNENNNKQSSLTPSLHTSLGIHTWLFWADLCITATSRSWTIQTGSCRGCSCANVAKRP